MKIRSIQAFFNVAKGREPTSPTNVSSAPRSSVGHARSSSSLPATMRSDLHAVDGQQIPESVPRPPSPSTGESQLSVPRFPDWQALPPEVWLNILSQTGLNQLDMAHLKLVSRGFVELTEDQVVWRRLAPGNSFAGWTAQANAMPVGVHPWMRRAFIAAGADVETMELAFASLHGSLAGADLLPDMSVAYRDGVMQGISVAVVEACEHVASGELDAAEASLATVTTLSASLDGAEPLPVRLKQRCYPDGLACALSQARAYAEEGDVSRTDAAIAKAKLYAQRLDQDPPDVAQILQRGIAIGIQREIRTMLSCMRDGDAKGMHAAHETARTYAVRNEQTLPARLDSVLKRGEEAAAKRAEYQKLIDEADTSAGFGLLYSLDVGLKDADKRASEIGIERLGEPERAALYRKCLKVLEKDARTHAREGWVTLFESDVQNALTCTRRLGEMPWAEDEIDTLRRQAQMEALAKAKRDAVNDAEGGWPSLFESSVREGQQWATRLKAPFLAAERTEELRQRAHVQASVRLRKSMRESAAGGWPSLFEADLRDARTSSRSVGHPFLSQSEIDELRTLALTTGVARSRQQARRDATGGYLSLFESSVKDGRNWAAKIASNS